MNYLELEYQIWEREENYGMYDYSDNSNKTYPSIVIKNNTKIYKHRTKHHLIIVPEGEKELTDNEDYESFVRIEFKKGSVYLVDDPSLKNEK